MFLVVKALKKVSGFSLFRLQSKISKQIGNNAKKQMLDDRSKMPVNKKSFIKTKKFCDTFLICCLHIKVTFLKNLSQSIKFPWSYSFLKYPIWANNISREKEAIKKISSLSKQSPPRNTSQESGPIRASIRLLQFDFWALFLFSNNLTFRLSSHICIGINSEITFSFKAVEMKVRRQMHPRLVENQTRR